MRNILSLAAMTLLAFVLTVAIYTGHSKNYPLFNVWWDAEGLPILIITWLVLGALFLGFGWLRQPKHLTNRFSRQRAVVLLRFQMTKTLQPAATRALARRG